ncbi:WS/DGAT domain-containing protein [Amycolatopsis sp. NPDC005003]
MHTLVSHVRGPAEPVTFGGAPVRAAIPLSVGETGNLTVVFEVLSYAGTLTISMLADRSRCPDLEALAEGLSAELDLVRGEAERRPFGSPLVDPGPCPTRDRGPMLEAGTEVTMTTSVKTRPPVRSRRAGYLVGVVLNGVLLALVNGRPGWEAVPFLTPGFSSVVGLVDLALVAGLVTGLVHIWYDPAWLVALNGVVTSCAGLAALVRLWQVFPLDFAGASFDWALVARIVLIVGLAGTSIGLLVQLLTLARAGVRRH